MTQKELEHQLKVMHKEAFLWARQCCFYDSDTANEVLQQVYLKVLEGRAKYRGKSTVKTWLFSVVKYTAIDLLKKESKFSSLDMADISMLQNDTSETEAENYEALLKLLPERQQEVLLLVFYHNLTLEEVAGVLNVSLGTVRTHYDRGKKKLKELIQDKYAYGR
ncbi:RNA polymerase sigma factor [Fulvivirga maritima]|uniref:RNA polymerase sigma factor n=1 Tax=Fulvivirga maritima TaxID=2904247 RepID=UPI001F1BBCB5|nr:RNA polymerase sigma factor [Fulvivirga maritima]UII28048.1 RNA polymerase sigma factor [Fulvivirga maritima]